MNRSADPAGDVAFGARIVGVGEDLRGVVVFDKLAEMEERGLLADARGLLHGVGHDHHREAVRNSSISSSTCAVAMGSSAEQGSSIRRTSGLVATARAMHRRCCWPPDRPVPGCVEAVLRLVPQRGAAQRFLHDLVQLRLVGGQPVDARAVGDVVVDRLRERVGLLEDHADLGAQLHRVDAIVVDILAVERDLPSTRATSIVSFIRLRQRRKVDLPQPEGPMNAVTVLSLMSTSTSLIAWVSP
jgi:hypothetical protein